MHTYKETDGQTDNFINLLQVHADIVNCLICCTLVIGESYAVSTNASIYPNYGGGAGGMISTNIYSCCIGGGGGGGGHSSNGILKHLVHMFSCNMHMHTCVGERPRTHYYGNVKPAYGGKAYGISLLTEKVFMGSGGGGGGRDSQCCALPGSGGNGGGIVMIFTPVITGSGGTISARGARGQDAGHNIGATGGEHGGGGGGAGGSILLATHSFGVPVDGSISLDIRGGVGGKESNPTYYAPGGKGSSGRFMWYKLPRLERGPLSLN